jgi:flagellar biosynthesis protein FlhF
MKIRKYYVRDMKEGLLRIREDLGPEAVIIQSRKVRLKGLKGFFAPRKMEITAAVENNSRFKEQQTPMELNLGRRFRRNWGSCGW